MDVDATADEGPRAVGRGHGLSAREASAALRVHHPGSRTELGLFAANRDFLAELAANRHHVGVLFRRDFRASYTGTFLGVFWNVAIPLAPVAVYVLLASAKVLPAFEGVPGPAAITFNATLWFLFAGAIVQPIAVVRSRASDAMKTSLPLSASVAASFARLVFETLVRLGVVFAVLVALRVVPALTAPLALLYVSACLLPFLAVGLMLAVVNVVVPDVERVVNIVLQYGMFLSGVIFPLHVSGALAVVEAFNPFAIAIRGAREMAFVGIPGDAAVVLAVPAIGLLLFLYAARVFYVMEPRVKGVP